MSGLFREDRIKRIGNEDSQMPGEQVFRYALCFFKGSWEKTDVLKQMYEFKYPAIPTHHGRHEGKLFGKRHSFLKLTPDTLCMTALKKAEKGRDVILRFYNPLNKTVHAKLWSYYNMKKACLCHLDETGREILEIKADGCEIEISVPQKKIVTIRISF
jgi:alpha-mannosidase